MKLVDKILKEALPTNFKKATNLYGEELPHQAKTIFKYKGESRPYSDEPIYKEKRRNKDYKQVEVNLDDLIATEGGQDIETLKKYYEEEQEGIPIVVKWKDDFYINDGHHRLSVLKYKGKKRATVNLIDLD